MNPLRQFAKECVDLYAKYDKCDDFYSLFVNELPEFTQHEFAALIMSIEESYASEATGPDNRHWHTIMQPALIRYLKNSTNRDEEIEFTHLWRSCVTDYMRDRMQELLDDYLTEYNFDHGFARPANYYYGVPAHGSL